MDALDLAVSDEEIRKFERIYNDAFENDTMSDKIKFEYSWCLIKSKHSFDIKKGITILNELCQKNVNDRRDYMYYLAIGYSHIKNYKRAVELLDLILKVEPTNRQVLDLKTLISKKDAEETTKDVVKVGGVVMIAGALAGIGFALLKNKYSKKE